MERAGHVAGDLHKLLGSGIALCIKSAGAKESLSNAGAESKAAGRAYPIDGIDIIFHRNDLQKLNPRRSK